MLSGNVQHEQRRGSVVHAVPCGIVEQLRRGVLHGVHDWQILALCRIVFPNILLYGMHNVRCRDVRAGDWRVVVQGLSRWQIPC